MGKPQISKKTSISTLAANYFPAYVIKQILFTKNPFAFGDNSDFLISPHQFLAII